MLVDHGVEFLLVGGGGAIVHGANRPTLDIDCLTKSDRRNLERVAVALRELNARLRVGRMTDEEASTLKVPVDAEFLANNVATTWTTDAGPVDVMLTMPDRHGVRHSYEHFVERSESVEYEGVMLRVAALSDIVASKEYANRAKDNEALPELHQLLGRHDGE